MVSISTSFPPKREKGCRVWSLGYSSHGPLDGPKVDIPAHIGGSITSIEQPYRTMDQLLYTIEWDNGLISKHYYKSLFTIGRFQNYDDFKAAIDIKGPVELTIGPQGGFRFAKVGLIFDGNLYNSVIEDKYLWEQLIEPLAKENSIDVNIVKLPPKQRSKGSSNYKTKR